MNTSSKTSSELNSLYSEKLINFLYEKIKLFILISYRRFVDCIKITLIKKYQLKRCKNQ